MASGSTIEKTLGDAAFTVTGTAKYDPDHATISYESSDSTVATVDTNGTVTMHKPGETTITVKSAATDRIAAGEASYILKVAKYQPALTLSADDYGNLYYDGEALTEDEYEKAQFDGLEGWAPTAEITYSFYSSKTDAEAGGAATVTPENARYLLAACGLSGRHQLWARFCDSRDRDSAGRPHSQCDRLRHRRLWHSSWPGLCGL